MEAPLGSRPGRNQKIRRLKAHGIGGMVTLSNLQPPRLIDDARNLLQSSPKELTSPSSVPSPPLRQKPIRQLSDLKALGQTPGAATLREISVDLNSFGPYDSTRRPANRPRPPAVDPQILKPFVALTDLHWATQGDHSKLCFSKPPKDFAALENLQKLKVRSHLRSPSFLDIGMKLP